jgi:hypothetical protein
MVSGDSFTVLLALVRRAGLEPNLIPQILNSRTSNLTVRADRSLFRDMLGRTPGLL